MNFTEAVADVLTIIKRPEKLVEAQREVNAAINFYCTRANFARDLVEVSQAISSSVYTQSLALSLFPRWRKFLYIRPSSRLKYVTNRPADHVINNLGVEERDVYYVAGDSVVFKLCQLESTLLIGYFTYPPTLTDASPTFWLLDVSPYFIINKAASVIMAGIGNDSEAKRLEALAEQGFQAAKKDYMYGASYG